jgi:predicted MFS family arabinose efflux permease
MINTRTPTSKTANTRLLIGGMIALMIAMGIGRFAYTPILPLMQEALGFSDATAGSLASANYAGYFVGAVLTSLLPLRTKRNASFRAGLAAGIVTTGLMGVSHSYALMHAIRFLSGVASAFLFVLTSSIVLDRLAHAGKTNHAGYLYAGVGLGIAFSTLFIPGLNALFRWEGVWIGLSVLSGLLAVPAWRWVTDSPSANLSRTSRAEPPASAPAPPAKWLPWLIIAYGLEGLGYIVTGTFLVAIAEKTSALRIDPAVVWVVVGLSAMPSCIVWSTLAKRWGFVASLTAAMLLQAVGIALPALWLSPGSLMISALLFGATFMGITTLAATLARRMSPTNSGRIIGILTAVYAAGQMAGPAIAGLLMAQTQHFHAALIGAAGVVFVGALLFASGIRFERNPQPGPR